MGLDSRLLRKRALPVVIWHLEREEDLDGFTVDTVQSFGKYEKVTHIVTEVAYWRNQKALHNMIASVLQNDPQHPLEGEINNRDCYLEHYHLEAIVTIMEMWQSASPYIQNLLYGEIDPEILHLAHLTFSQLEEDLCEGDEFWYRADY